MDSSKSSKRYISIFCTVVGTGLLLVILLIILIDPFFHYHMPWFGLEPVVNNEIYQNPGLAKHASYDSVIIGSSMTENFDAAWFDEAYGIHTLKLNYEGASAENLRIAVECARDEKGKNLKYVFGCLDMEILTVDAEKPIFPLPEYLYDDFLCNDIYYLLNKDVLFQDVWNVLKENAEGTIEPINKAYCWYEDQKDGFSKENVLQHVDLPESFDVIAQQEPMILEETVRSVEKIKDFILKYPETNFQFFYSPYSIAYWYNSYAAGRFLIAAENLEYSMKELLECENLDLYFPSNPEMITDLDSYKDLGHYDMGVQYQIFEEMKNEKNMLTMENYGEYMEDFRQMVLESNFELYFDL